MANKGYGSTTVAATMRIASMAGIRVFATGGIGGVHRGAEVGGKVLVLGRYFVSSQHGMCLLISLSWALLQ